MVRSPAPALVVATPVAAGDEVAEGAPVLVLESMKMETVLRAPFRALVRERPVPVGTQVETGTPLLRLEPLPDEDGAVGDGAAVGDAVTPGEQAIDLPAVADDGSAEDLAGACLRDLRGLLLGFDGDADDRTFLLAAYLGARAELGGELVPAEGDLLTVFADLSELSRSRPVRHAGAADADLAETGGPASFLHSPREHFHVYLRSLDADRAGLPEPVRARLHRVLTHYGVTGPDRTPELETAVFRIFLAQQRICLLYTLYKRQARPRAGGPGPGTPHRGDPGAVPRRVRPRPRRPVPLVHPAAAVPRQGSRVRRGPRGPAPPRRASGRRRPRRPHPGDGRRPRAPRPAARAADQPLRAPDGRRPARPGSHAAAGGPDPPLLRQPPPGERHRRRRRRLPVCHRGAHRHPRLRPGRRRDPRRGHHHGHRRPAGRGRGHRGPVRPAARRLPGRRHLRRLGRPARRRRDRRGGHQRRLGAAGARRGRPDHRHGRRHRGHRHAAPLHLRARRRRPPGRGPVSYTQSSASSVSPGCRLRTRTCACCGPSRRPTAGTSG